MKYDEINWKEPIEITSRTGTPEQYHQFDDRTAMAIRGALGARRPLLIRGLPGVGKTQLAHAAAKILQRPIVQRVVDSRTESRDLLWTYDPILRLADAQLEATMASMGLDDDDTKGHDSQKLLADQKNAVRDRLDPMNYVQPGPLWWAFNWDHAAEQADRCKCQREVYQPPADPKNGTVVLIDEIDKADSDVPNGLLEALGTNRFLPFCFKHPVEATGEPPLVIITTNEERALPDAFVRRCLVLHLKLPTETEEFKKLLIERAKIHFPKNDHNLPIFRQAAALIVKDREEAARQNATPLPGQAEYLDLLRAVFGLAEEADDHLKLLKELREFTLKKTSGPDAEE